KKWTISIINKFSRNIYNYEYRRVFYHKYHLFEVIIDQDLLDVMDVLIWLKRVEIEGLSREEMDYINN
ncbi:hypothetical protein QU768_04245, partial [Proteus mirabilis]|nr:hypothetical protein [Proteus mirabilis]